MKTQEQTRPPSARRVVRGFAFLSSGSLISQAIGFAALIVAARRLGPANLGPYNFSYSVTQYFTLFIDFGVTLLAIREIAQRPQRAREIMGEVFVLELGLGAIALIALVALAPVLGPDHKSRTLLPIVGVLMLLTAAISLGWALRAVQRLQAVAASQLAGQTVYGALVPVFVGGGLAGAVAFAWLHVLGAAVTALVVFAWVWRTVGLPKPTFDVRALWRRLRRSVPIGFSFVMIQVYYSVDSLMLGYMRNTATVGQYGIAYRLPLSIIGFASLWVAALYPHASAMFVRDREALRRQVGTFASFAVIVALPLGVAVTVAGAGLMPELFGHRYAPAGTPFVLLVWAAAVIIVSVNFGNVMLACGDERRYAIGVTAGAIVNVAVNLVVIPAFGASGAASATIAAEVVVLIYMIERFRRVLGPVELDWPRIARAAVATAVMAGVLAALPGSLAPLARLAIGGAVYLAAAIATGALRADDVRMLRGRGAQAGEPAGERT